MRSRGGVPSARTEEASDTGSSYSWHTDHPLIGFAARSGLFWSATLRVQKSDGTPEARGPSEPDFMPVASTPVAGTPPGDSFVVAAVALGPVTASVEPLVMASLCDLLYDEPGQSSKADWTQGQWDAALQQQLWTASWRFLGQSSVNPQVYFGVAFENIATGQIAIANRGTQTAYDLLVSDIDILKGIVPPAFFAAAQFACEIVTAHRGSGREILVTGHSLGGAEAQYQAAKLGLGGSTFAALGVAFATPDCAPYLVNYLYPQDAIANLAPHIGSVAYIQPNGPVQWFDLLATLQYAGEGLHFINNYLEHFGAPGIEPITPVQFVEAIVLAEVADFFSENSQFGFDELAWPAAPSAVASAFSAPIGNAVAADLALAATLYPAVLSMPTAPDQHPA